MTKADQFRDLTLTPGTPIPAGGTLRGCTAEIVVEGMPRWSSPTARITFDDGSVATFPISKIEPQPISEGVFPPGFFPQVGC